MQIKIGKCGIPALKKLLCLLNSLLLFRTNINTILLSFAENLIDALNETLHEVLH